MPLNDHDMPWDGTEHWVANGNAAPDPLTSPLALSSRGQLAAHLVVQKGLPPRAAFTDGGDYLSRCGKEALRQANVGKHTERCKTRDGGGRVNLWLRTKTRQERL